MLVCCALMWCNLFVPTFLTVGFCILMCAAQPSAQVTSRRVPKFVDYQVKTQFTGVPAKPRFTNPSEPGPDHQYTEGDLLPGLYQRYRESVSLEAATGPNFAGFYTIARWSCGTGCSFGVVVDARTGRLYRMPYRALDIMNPGSEDYGGLSFQLESSLLIVEGCTSVDQHEAGCSRSYYSWMAPRFILLRRVPLAVQ